MDVRKRRLADALNQLARDPRGDAASDVADRIEELVEEMLR